MRRVLVIAGIVWAALAGAWPRPPQNPLQALRRAPQYVQIRSTRQFTLVADQIAATAGRAATVGLVAPRTMLDSFAGDGPGFMVTPATSGGGHLSLGAFGLSSAFTSLDGHDLAGTLETLNPVVFQAAPPATLVAATLAYDIELRQSVAAITATYGVTDDLDLSLVLPIVTTRLDLGVESRVTHQGPELEPVRAPRRRGGTTLSATGIGDLILRAKWVLSYQPVRSALWTMVAFPTGDVAKLAGTGDYWVSLGGAVGKSFYQDRVNLVANVGIDFDVGGPGTQVSYSAGLGSWVIVPRLLNIGAVFTGQSELDPQIHPGDTNVLTLAPNGSLMDLPALGVPFERQDTFGMALSARLILGLGFVAFVGAVFPLGSGGLRASVATPVVGIGGVW